MSTWTEDTYPEILERMGTDSNASTLPGCSVNSFNVFLAGGPAETRSKADGFALAESIPSGVEFGALQPNRLTHNPRDAKLHRPVDSFQLNRIVSTLRIIGVQRRGLQARFGLQQSKDNRKEEQRREGCRDQATDNGATKRCVLLARLA